MATKLKWLETPDFESSNIASIKFCSAMRIMLIEFKDDSVYQYFHVPYDLWKEILKVVKSELSVGKWFHKNIKNKYDYIKI